MVEIKILFIFIFLIFMYSISIQDSQSSFLIEMVALITLFNFFLVYLFFTFKLGILIVEFWVMLIWIFFNTSKEDPNYLVFSYGLMGLSFLSMSFILIKSIYSAAIVFIVLVFKSLMISFFILMSKDLKDLSGGILGFILSSKCLVLFYGFLLKSVGLKEKMLEIFYSNTGFFFIFISWGALIMISYMLLLCKDLEGYFMSLLNISHMTVMIFSFFDFKIFLLSFLLDGLLFILFLILKVLEVDLLYYSSVSGISGSLLLFGFLGHLLGMPPYPSFFLEMGFMYSQYYLLVGMFKLLLLGIFYGVMVFQFYILFLYLGSLSNKPKYFLELSSEGSMVLVLLIGVSISLFFQFLLFYGL